MKAAKRARLTCLVEGVRWGPPCFYFILTFYFSISLKNKFRVIVIFFFLGKKSRFWTIYFPIYPSNFEMWYFNPIYSNVRGTSLHLKIWTRLIYDKMLLKLLELIKFMLLFTHKLFSHNRLIWVWLTCNYDTTT